MTPMRMFVALVAGALAATQASAQAWPAKTVRIIVPHSAGAPFDGMVRSAAQLMAQSLGQPFVLENRDGADGIIGAEACARAAPDGHTFCATTSSVMSLNPAIYAKLPYDPARDFTPVVHMGVLNSLIFANPSVPASSMKELLELVRAKPGSISFATMGNTSFNSLLIGWLKAKRGTEFYAIPYKNVTQAMTAAVAGEVQVSAYAIGLAANQVKAGKVKPLAVASSRRSDILPDVPTLAEAGVDMVIPRNWVGMFAPAGAPREAVLRVNAETARALATPAFRAKLMTTRGIEPDENTGRPAEAFAEYLKGDRENYADIVAAIGLKKQ